MKAAEGYIEISGIYSNLLKTSALALIILLMDSFVSLLRAAR
jgi:hypothetical protein